MRVWDISLFLIIFNLIAGLMYPLLLGIIPGGFGQVQLGTNFTESSERMGMILNTASNQDVSLQLVFSWFNVAFQLLLILLPMIFTILVGMIVGTFLILQNIGVPSNIAIFIQGLLWVIFAIGLWQMSAGRSMREYE